MLDMPGKKHVVSLGQVFGKLTVTERVATSRSGGTRYLCRCECGTERTVFSGHLVRGNTTSCGCSRVKSGAAHAQWAGYGDISGNFFWEIKRSASGDSGRTPLEFNLTIEYLWDLFLQQNRRCALSGISLVFAKHLRGPNRDPQTASLDRIDSGAGYVVGNVQWVHKDVNRMKSVFTQDRYLEICRMVAAQHPV
jgi:hypothetical protein